jgi:hypothetical protein
MGLETPVIQTVNKGKQGSGHARGVTSQGGNSKDLTGIYTKGGTCGLIRNNTEKDTKKREEERPKGKEKQVLHGCKKFVLRNVRLSPETNEIWKRLEKRKRPKMKRVKPVKILGG